MLTDEDKEYVKKLITERLHPDLTISQNNLLLLQLMQEYPLVMKYMKEVDI